MPTGNLLNVKFLKNVFLISKIPLVVQKMIKTISMQLLISGIHFKCQDRKKTYEDP